MEGMFLSEGVTKSDRMLHTSGTFAKNNLLYVQEVGKLQSLSPHICRRERLDSFLIFEVLEGKGVITFEDKKRELRKNECIWIDCHQPFEHISSEGEPWKLAWVHFNGKCAKEFYELFREKNEDFVFIPLEIKKIQNLIEQILNEVKENASELEIHSLLTQLITECCINKKPKNRSQEIREFINTNYKEEELIEVIESRFKLQRENLEGMFEQNYGIGLREYILNRRFNVAKELLRFTIKPIDNIIIESGIRNEDLFYQLFKEKESISPEEYRKSWAQWIKD